MNYAPQINHTTPATVRVETRTRRQAPRPARTHRATECERRTGTRQHGMPMVVSATSFDVDGAVRGMVRPTVPNYALRRMLVGSVAALALLVGFVAAVGAVDGFAGTPASAADVTMSADAPTTHVAQAGDTLWSIANTYRGDVGRDRYIDALIRLNGGTTIQAGAQVLLP